MRVTTSVRRCHILPVLCLCHKSLITTTEGSGVLMCCVHSMRKRIMAAQLQAKIQSKLRHNQVQYSNCKKHCGSAEMPGLRFVFCVLKNISDSVASISTITIWLFDNFAALGRTQAGISTSEFSYSLSLVHINPKKPSIRRALVIIFMIGCLVCEISEKCEKINNDYNFPEARLMPWPTTQSTKSPETSSFVILSDNKWEQIFTLTKPETRKNFHHFCLKTRLKWWIHHQNS